MASDWKNHCRGNDFEIDGEDVVVRLAGDRFHRVSVNEEEHVYRLASVVVRPAIAASIDDLALRGWARNLGTELVGFKMDGRGRFFGEAWVPKAGLAGPEFATYLRAVAAECDRFEYHLTGTDAA